MMLWYVLLTLLLVALAVLWCPVYVHFYYRDTLRIKVKFLFFTFVLPRGKLLEKAPNLQSADNEAREKVAAAPKKENKLLSLVKERGVFGFLALLRTTIGIVAKSGKKAFEKIHIKRFELSLVVVGEDAADTAIKYGQAQALVGVAATVLLRGVSRHLCRVNVRPGFNEKESSVDFYAKVCFLPASVLKIAIGALFDFVKEAYYSNTKPNRKGVANE